MKRIDTATVEADLFGTGKDGFTGGDPDLFISPTALNADWCNNVQEELARVVEGNPLGLALNGSDYDQVQSVLRAAHNGTLFTNISALTHPAGHDVANGEYLDVYCGDGSELATGISPRAMVVGGQTGGGNAFAAHTTTHPYPGAAWTDSSLNASNMRKAYGVTYNVILDLWIVVGSDFAAGTGAAIQTSPESGFPTWTNRSAAADTGIPRSIAWRYSDGLTVIVGSSGLIQSSTNGTSWTARTPGSSYSGTFNEVIWVDDLDLFVAVGSGAEIQTSPDGTTWTRRNNGTSNDACVCYSKSLGQIMVVFGNSACKTSPDGITWTTQSTVTTFSKGVAAVGGSFVTIYSGSGGADTYISSDLGATWYGLRNLGGVISTSWYPTKLRLTYHGDLSLPGVYNGHLIMTGGATGGATGPKLVRSQAGIWL